MPKRSRSSSPLRVPAVPNTKFDPVALGLPEDFVLTDYTLLKGCSCKLPQPKLFALLQAVSTAPGREDVGMDCSIVALHHRNETGQPLFLISTTDFFFPSVEDPFLQGQIGAANVLSDLYSMGITECDTVLMLLAASTNMSEVERDVTTREIMKGFAERVRKASTSVTGGQTVMNPWPLIGGVAMRVVAESEMIRPAGLLRVGDFLVLTKPLGNQIAVNLKQWLHRPSPLYEDCIAGNITEEEIEALYYAATESMKRLNRTGSQLMHKYKSHGATDVTGFGILGHARNFGAAQAETENPQNLCLLFERLPIYATAVKASRLMKDKYRLFEGFSSETSGGLLVALPDADSASKFIHDIKRIDHEPAWVVGRVAGREPAGPFAKLVEGYEIIEV